LNALIINIEVAKGAPITEAARELRSLARRLGVTLGVTFNGVNLEAHPADSLLDVLRRFEARRIASEKK
jgi:hypothetical protein